MRFAFPMALAVAGVAALATVAIHFIAWRRPQPRSLPTARFLPSRDAPSRLLALAPSDLALLALRVLAVLAIGLAVAGPVVHWRRAGLARVVVADVSGAVASIGEVRDSVQRVLAGADRVRLVLADSLPRVAPSGALDGAAASAAPTPLSAALVLALREGAALRAQGDRVEVVLVSPFVRASVDAAVPALVRSWGTPVRLVHVAPSLPRAPAVVAGAKLPDASDPVAAAAWRAWGRVPPHLRLVRGAASDADLAFARAGGTLVTWPVDTSVSGGAIVAGDAVAIGPFGHIAGETAGRVVARWQDGTPAATEAAIGTGCVRDARIAVPARGDATLRPAFVGVARALTAPCAAPDFTPADPALLVGSGGGTPLPVPLVPDPWLARLLWGLAAIALGAEQWLRRRRGRAPAPAIAAPRREAA